MEQNLIRLLKADEIECRVSVINEKGLSLLLYKVAKQDVGTTGYAEKEKSQASDSFKRACFNWGIGRELYTAPFIWIPAGKVSIQSKENRYICNDRFSVSSIQYNDNREISGLVIVNDGGKTVYELKAKGAKSAGGSEGKTADKNSDQGKAAQQIPQKDSASLSKEQMDSLQAELDRTGVTMETVQNRYKIQEPGTMSKELYGRVMSALKRTKSSEAA